MKGYPNTYALSKILAEDLVYSFRENFPIFVSRPSIVISAYEEPYRGWIESKKNGLIGILLARGRGLLRTILGDPDRILEVIPVDIANNAIIALTCKRALMGGNDALYSNLTNSGLQKWTIKQYFNFETEILKEYPLDLLIWWPWCAITSNRFYYQFRRLFYHYIPAVFGDFGCRIYGEKAL